MGMNRLALVISASIFTIGSLCFNSGKAHAQGNLTLYCGVPEEWCRLTVNAFEKKTGIKVAMTRKSAGEIYAQVKAEKDNPRGDIWWGGSGDPHLQAAEEDLTLEYKTPQLSQMHDWSVRQAEQSKFRTIGIFAGPLGFGFNTELMARAGGPEPKCWADLVDPRFKNDVQSSDPNSSGTAYVLIATLIQLMGEDAAFDYMKKLHRNVSQYNKAGGGAAMATGVGESLIGITFLDDLSAVLIGGRPVKLVAPCEGTGYQVGSMSIIKGARNLDNAKLWYEWALTPEAQVYAAQAKFFHVQSNKATPPAADAPKVDVKLINYDFAKYGSGAERKRLLAKWDAEVKSLPK